MAKSISQRLKGAPRALGVAWSVRVGLPRALRQAQTSAEAAPLRAPIEPRDSGRAEVGARLVEGVFRFAGAEIRVDRPEAVWSAAAPSLGWREAAHSFEWLADLEAVGNASSAACARRATRAWIDAAAAFDPLIWRPDLAARRLRRWFEHAALIAPTEPDGEAALLSAMSAHAAWVAARMTDAPPGAPRIFAASAALSAALLIEGRDGGRQAAAAALEAAVLQGVTPDGAMISRSPSDIFEVFRLLDAIRREHQALGAEPPDVVVDALPRMAGALRHLRMPDGGLPMFHGGREESHGDLDLVLARSEQSAPAVSALPDARFERMAGGRVMALMDVGRAAGDAVSGTQHASSLAVEIASGRRRLVVNCGSGAHIDAGWRRACRTTAAHSTLTLDDTASASSVEAPAGPWHVGLRRTPGWLLDGPANVISERKEERNGVWVLGAHDGYLVSHGLSVTRRMFLGVDGGDLRGEDNLEVEPGGEATFKRRLGRLKGAGKALGVPFAVRFHLHPDVVADLVAEGEAVTLKLPHGEVWVMRQAGGARLSIEPSVYLPRAATPVESRQIVVSGGVGGAGLGGSAQVRWAFRRVGDALQAPADIDALLAQEADEGVGFEGLGRPPFQP